jgi:hypothetical protein
MATRILYPSSTLLTTSRVGLLYTVIQSDHKLKYNLEGLLVSLYSGHALKNWLLHTSGLFVRW